MDAAMGSLEGKLWGHRCLHAHTGEQDSCRSLSSVLQHQAEISLLFDMSCKLKFWQQSDGLTLGISPPAIQQLGWFIANPCEHSFITRSVMSCVPLEQHVA